MIETWAVGVAKTRTVGMAKIGTAGVAGLGAVGITMSTAALGSSGISMVGGMNMQNNQRLHQKVMQIYKKKKKKTWEQ